MMRSLSSAVAGLRTHQTKMDVIGNNIANVNTYGFKASRATFNDVYYQTLSAGRGNDGPRGGQNPTQIGYGSQLSTIDVKMTNGGGGYTGKATDVYIDGDGFLTVRDADNNTHYTRLGNLTIDGTNLVDYLGNKVQGIPLATQTVGGVAKGPYKDGGVAAPLSGDFYTEAQLKPITFENATVYEADGTTPKATAKNILDCVTSISIGSDGSITGVTTERVTYPLRSPVDPNAETIEKNKVIYLGKIAVATFPNQEGLVQRGMSQFDVGANAGTPRYGIADSQGAGKTKAGYLEMANVELSQEFTDMITTQRGFQANTRIITVSDEMLQELVNLKR